MKNDKKSKEEKHGHAVVVCSIIGRKGAPLDKNNRSNDTQLSFICNDFFVKEEGYYLFSHKKHVVCEIVPKTIVDDVIKKTKDLQDKKEDKDYNPLKELERTTNNKGKVVWIRPHFPVGDYNPDKKIITLYEKNIELSCRGKNNTIDGLKKHIYICKTYLHEFSHAYFHISNGKKHKYIREIEEAIAELYTLTYLDYLKSKNYDFWQPVYDCAYEDDTNLQNEIGWLAVYGFGAYMYDKLQSKDDRFKFIENFKNKISLIDIKNTDVKKYRYFVRYPKHMGHQDECWTLLQRILQWP